MKVTLIAVSLLTKIIAGVFCEDVKPLCCNVNPSCKNISNISNITIQQFANHSPFYLPIFSIDSEVVRYSSGCTTYFKISKTTYLQFESIVYKDGTRNIKVFVTSDVPGQPGVFRVQGLYRESSGNRTTVYNAFIKDANCDKCEPLYLLYKCYLYDDCDLVHPSEDVVVGMSSSKNTPSSCLDRFESLSKETGLNVSAYVRLDGARRCVAYFNGIKCVNAEGISEDDIIRLPQD